MTPQEDFDSNGVVTVVVGPLRAITVTNYDADTLSARFEMWGNVVGGREYHRATPVDVIVADMVWRFEAWMPPGKGNRHD